MYALLTVTSIHKDYVYGRSTVQSNTLVTPRIIIPPWRTPTLDDGFFYIDVTPREDSPGD